MIDYVFENKKNVHKCVTVLLERAETVNYDTSIPICFSLYEGFKCEITVKMINVIASVRCVVGHVTTSMRWRKYRGIYALCWYVRRAVRLLGGASFL